MAVRISSKERTTAIVVCAAPGSAINVINNPNPYPTPTPIPTLPYLYPYRPYPTLPLYLYPILTPTLTS